MESGRELQLIKRKWRLPAHGGKRTMGDNSGVVGDTSTHLTHRQGVPVCKRQKRIRKEYASF